MTPELKQAIEGLKTVNLDRDLPWSVKQCIRKVLEASGEATHSATIKSDMTSNSLEVRLAAAKTMYTFKQILDLMEALPEYREQWSRVVKEVNIIIAAEVEARVKGLREKNGRMKAALSEIACSDGAFEPGAWIYNLARAALDAKS